MKPFRLLVTRPVSENIVNIARTAALEITQKEFITVGPIRSAQLAGTVKTIAAANNNIAFTSKHAVISVAAMLDDPEGLPWKIFCIGGSTSDHVREKFGENHIAGTASDAAGLANLIAAQNIENLVFFCGDKRRDELPQGLLRSGISVQEVVVYRTIASPQHIRERFDGIAFFSPSAVDSFFSMNTPDADTVCFSIGSTTTRSLQNYVTSRIVTSTDASETSLLQAVLSYRLAQDAAQS